MDSAILRVFVAIELDPRVRAQLKQFERQLQTDSAASAVRWVAPQNMHLTLKFLGNVERARLDTTQGALARAAAGIPPFELVARGLDCFPNTRRQNNLWIELEGDVETAALLARRIEDEFAALGFPREARGFTPHLTLGRVKHDASLRARAAVGELAKTTVLASQILIRVDAIHLVRSDLQPGGPVYSLLYTERLKNDIS